MNEFDNKVKVHEQDENYINLVVDPFDVRDTLKQKKEAGVANFW